MEKGILPVSLKVCRVRGADVQPAAYGVVVEPFVGLGRVADELLDAVDKVGKGGAMSLPSLAVYKDDLHGDFGI